MRMLISGDNHIHMFGQYAAGKNSTDNSRFKAIMAVLYQMLSYSITNKIFVIVLNGDIFETKNILEAYVNNAFWDWCLACEKAGIKVILNTGNHDISSLGDESITLLHPYKSLQNVTVVDKFTVLNAYDHFDGFVNLVVIPFRRNVADCRLAIEKCMEEIQTKPEIYKGEGDPANILLYHGAILGAKLKSEEFRDDRNALTLEDLKPSFFDYVFLSHFHIRQKLAPNVIYVGSPLHHDMSDAGDDSGSIRGFYDIDFRTNKLLFQKTEYPEFHNIVINTRNDLENIKCLDITKHYYKIRVTTPEVTEADIQFPETPYVKVCYEAEFKTTSRIDDIDVHTDINTVIDKYIDFVNPPLDTKRLAEVGKKYIASARKGVTK